ncbi:hypothetical protein FRC07_006865 [Ceratobasidium sp. 392]|nr:hypothetical protein FRC07_006865 [Ceratobasidium sp. 392]
MIMIPGVGFFYSGLLRRKNALSMMYFSMTSLAVVSLQWFFWGYSLTYSSSASRFIGDLKHFALMGVYDQPSMGSPHIPANVFCLYQLMFAAFTPALALGGFAEHCRLGPIALFVFVWSTLVYDPIACWTWNSNGWIRVMGDLDWAGGTPVHISSGTAALAISAYLGKRHGYGTKRTAYKPHNSTYVVLGTVLLWFGWFGFNGGSALSANPRAAQACMVTNLAASAGGITWMLWDYKMEKHWSVVGFCSGAVSGLVAITPAAGYVGAPAALVFGVVGASCCNFATHLKYLLHYDDCLDTLILWIFHAIPGLCLITTEQAEVLGMDSAYMGESAYDCMERDPERGHSAHVENPAPQMAPVLPPEPHPDPEPQEVETDEAHSHRATIGSRHRRPNNAVPSGRSAGS